MASADRRRSRAHRRGKSGGRPHPVIRPLPPVTIFVDSFPDLRLQGMSRAFNGTGSRFALLPPENATGNFVKVVQRVPVKVLLDDLGDALCRAARSRRQALDQAEYAARHEDDEE